MSSFLNRSLWLVWGYRKKISIWNLWSEVWQSETQNVHYMLNIQISSNKYKGHFNFKIHTLWFRLEHSIFRIPSRNLWSKDPKVFSEISRFMLLAQWCVTFYRLSDYVEIGISLKLVSWWADPGRYIAFKLRHAARHRYFYLDPIHSQLLNLNGWV